MTAVCTLFGRSRTWFHRWYTRYLAYGEEGLRDIERAVPAMQNQTPLDVKMAIIDFILRFPAYGPQRIADELTLAGTPVKRLAVYNVMKRRGINTRGVAAPCS